MSKLVVEMRKDLLIGICLLAMIIVGMIVFIPNQQGMTVGVKNNSVEQPSKVSTVESSDVAGIMSHYLVMNAPTKMAPDSILVYKSLTPDVNKEATLAFAKKFNVIGMLRGETTVQSEDLVYGVTLTKNSGSAEYMNAKRPNEKQDAPEYLPSDAEAIEIATKFLKDRDLFPEGAVDPTIYRENAYTIGKGDEIYYGKIGVWYHRMLNGLKVDGTQLVVYVGGNGDVIGYYANWRNYEPYKEYPVTSPQVAFDKLKTKGVPVGMNNPDTMASIDDVYLAYETTAGAYKEDFLKPVWVFKGNVSVDGKPAMPIEQYIPALTDDSVKELSL